MIITMLGSNHFIKCKISHEISIHIIREMNNKYCSLIDMLMSSFPLMWGISPDCTETSWSVEALAPGDILDSFQMGWLVLDLVHHGLLCAVPNKHNTQIGQWLRNCARCFGISPCSANAVWCKRQKRLIISSRRGDSDCGCTIFSRSDGSK